MSCPISSCHFSPLALDELGESERRNRGELKRIYAELLASEEADVGAR